MGDLLIGWEDLYPTGIASTAFHSLVTADGVQVAKLMGVCGLLLNGRATPEEVGRVVLAAASKSGSSVRRPQLMALMDDFKVHNFAGLLGKPTSN